MTRKTQIINYLSASFVQPASKESNFDTSPAPMMRLYRSTSACRTVKPSPQEITAVWRGTRHLRAHHKIQRPRRRSNRVKARSCHPFDLFKVVSSFRSISAGGAFCTTQRLAFVGQLRRPFASGRAPSPCAIEGVSKRRFVLIL